MQVTSLGHAGMLITTRQATIVCDPWFLPAFLGSWFVFPRNDQLPPELMAQVETADYLYISHLHADHFDEPWLAEHIRRDITVLLPQYPTRELERRIRALGFTTIQRTVNGEELDLGGGLTVAIHTETSITDGPGGDSALVVSDGESRIVNQNDCRTADLGALRAHGPVDLHWLQYSGAIWYPMVYHEPPERMRELIAAKVDSQYQRALRYVESIGARAVVPSAGPPCFLDPDLQHLNVITGDEPSIFPDQSAFLPMLAQRGIDGILAIPGSSISVTPTTITVTHPQSGEQIERIFHDKQRYLADYAADWAPWLHDVRDSWSAPSPDLLDRLAAWWEPLLAMAPTLCAAVGAGAVIRTGDLDIVVDFPSACVRRAVPGETFRYGFEIPRELVETVAA
jgi:UDP-MurNAc hydroxylase